MEAAISVARKDRPADAVFVAAPVSKVPSFLDRPRQFCTVFPDYFVRRKNGKSLNCFMFPRLTRSRLGAAERSRQERLRVGAFSSDLQLLETRDRGARVLDALAELFGEITHFRVPS